MDSGILSLTLFAALSSLLVFTDVDLSSHIIFFLQTLSSWVPIRPPNIKKHTTKSISIKPLLNVPKKFTEPNLIGDGREPKPSIKVEIPDSDRRRLPSCKPSAGPILYAPTPKGVDEHWGTHTGCPTVFKVNNKEYVLYENGDIYLCDEEGGLHSVTEMPSTGGSCRIPGEKFKLILDREGYVCMADDHSPVAQRLETWCLANDPQSGSAQLIPGRGCFSFRVSNCSAGSPLHNTMFGLGHIPEQNIEARNVTIHQLEQSYSPTSSTSTNSSNNPLPYPLTPTSPSTASGSPVSPYAFPEQTIAQGQTSIERRTCPQCNKVLRRPGALRIHMYSHMGHKPCRCPVANCGYASTNDTNLRRHIQTMHRSN